MRRTRIAQGSKQRRTIAPRRAFTLVEMLVSLAVIVVALAVVVTAFTITTQTARQAAAFTELQGWVRQFASQIQEDLRQCDPARSPLVLVGRVQPAALTVDDLAAQRRLRFLIGDPDAVPDNYDPVFNSAVNPEYSDPRADILMFFTNRPTVSQAPAPNPTSPTQEAITAGARSSPVQVVIGHAARGEAVRQGNGTFIWNNALTHIEDLSGPANLSRLPAGAWHLARRLAIPAVLTTPQPDPPDFTAQLPRLVRCEPTNAEAGDVVDFSTAEYLRWLNEFAIVPGNADLTPYELYDNSATLKNALDNILYADVNKHHIATVLDSPPVDLRSNLGVHMLPGCAWFQVEFLMPEDVRNSLDYDPPTANDPSPPSPLPTQRNQMAHWTQVDPGETYVFLPDTAENRAAAALSRRAEDFTRTNPESPTSLGPPVVNDLPHLRIRMWPYALRITVRAYDPRGRLPEPVVRTIIHRFE